MILTWYNRRAKTYGTVRHVERFSVSSANSAGDFTILIHALNNNKELYCFDFILTPEQFATLHVDSVEPLELSGLGEAVKECNGGYYFP